jgi:hypothetical protein
MTKKLKFGTYRITAEVTIDDEIDLDDHFDRAQWEAMKPREQQAWFEEYIESQAIADLAFDFKPIA